MHLPSRAEPGRAPHLISSQLLLLLVLQAAAPAALPTPHTPRRPALQPASQCGRPAREAASSSAPGSVAGARATCANASSNERTQHPAGTGQHWFISGAATTTTSSGGREVMLELLSRCAEYNRQSSAKATRYQFIYDVTQLYTITSASIVNCSSSAVNCQTTVTRNVIIIRKKRVSLWNL